MPTPGGVPVKIRSPGSSVTTCDRYASSAGTPKMNSFVDEFCIVWPLSRSWILRLCGSVTSSAVTSTGPVGANVSNVLPMVHCFSSPLNCQSRAETSCPTVYPPT